MLDNIKTLIYAILIAFLLEPSFSSHSQYRRDQCYQICLLVIIYLFQNIHMAIPVTHFRFHQISLKVVYLKSNQNGETWLF